MEKKIENLTIFTKYQHLQVILNYYLDEDMLVQRDGFHFESIQITADCLSFLGKNGGDFTINLKDYPEKCVNTDFQNFYILRNNTSRLEIYFPL
ncbi:hypothetical protein [Neobacillus ginsengisoli]|uniref:AraC family transcriptional regulator n=1 Tax=Neobacillus ginsengisoli TaxID=904295 RepID=A0ABT9XV27_9BACI|nr:hypothetical protein [Neobacillus ginsengisoli]MDQ0199418.1 hypothetical protein [Neobacillus ginsengisoli]